MSMDEVGTHCVGPRFGSGCIGSLFRGRRIGCRGIVMGLATIQREMGTFDLWGKELKVNEELIDLGRRA